MNALDSISNGSLSGKRQQTIRTGTEILDPLKKVWGRIAFDPVHVEGAITDPEEKLELDWRKIWKTVETIAALESGDPKTVLALLRCEIRASDVDSKTRAAAAEIRRQIREEYQGREALSVPWPDRTFVNPPFGDRGAETLFGTFRDFLEKFRESKNEIALLCPVRSHRAWWRAAMKSADLVLFLDPVTFLGYSQTFPAPLCLGYKGPRAGKIALAYASIGGVI